ncbi:hypothetical protein BJ546DRAFT_1015439 [Cryomyces antarcticus]
MIGKLFSRNASRPDASSQPASLDSHQEDLHTRSLLFPDPSILHQPQGRADPLETSAIAKAHTSRYDDDLQGGIDLVAARDIRVLVAQNESGVLPKSILFDSAPVAAPVTVSPKGERGASRVPSSSQGEGLYGARHTDAGSQRPNSKGNGPLAGRQQMQSTYLTGGVRRTSTTFELPQPPSPNSIGGGAFQRARLRAAPTSTLPHIEETTQSRLVRESEEEIKTCLNCMFGNVEPKYKGPSTKFHIFPTGSRSGEQSLTSPIVGEGYNAFAKLEGRRRSNLAQTHTPGNVRTGAFADPQDFPHTSTSSTRRRTVLITRTFSVSMADGELITDTTSEQTPTPQSSAGKENGFPFPASDSADGKKSTSQSRLRPTRSPMYAVAIVAKLPIAPFSGSVPPSRSGPARPGARTPGSFIGADSAGSSLDSDRRAGWILLDPAFGSDSMPSFGPANDVDSGVDAIAQHWEVISRTLTSMQLVIQEKILALLKIADAASPPALHFMRPPPFRPGGRDQNLQPMQSRSIKVQPGALSEDVDLKRLAFLAAERVVRGIKIPRVVTGQERWGIWRDEARSIGKWAGAREQNFFFYNLLSSFLGNHTEWLNNIGPIDYRRRHYDQQKSSPSEELTIASRTVIMSSDKMTARRLIFLLSAFFPVSSHVNFTSPSIRPVTSSSSPGLSQSPPSNMPVSRRESLRRTMNRRGRPNSSSMKLQGQGRERTFVNRESPDCHAQGVSFDLSNSKLVSRRESDVQSTKTANMPVLFGVEVTRKSSAATTSIVTPSEAVPVAHFNIPSGSATEARPGSSGSASANLMSRLQRNNSVSASNVSSSFQSGRRWSSLSFWSTGSRRESSTTERSDLPASSMASEKPLSGTHGDKPVVKGHQRENTLERMVKEVGKDHTVYQDDTEDSDLQPDHATPQSPEPTFNFSKDDPSLPSQPEPDRPAFASSYLKMSVDEKDGIIDVELPMDNFGFGSPLHSPSMGCFASVSSLGGSSWGQNSSYSCSPAEAEHPLSVAGWLESFHADFALQAVKPYTEFDKDVRRAMSAEPTPLAAVSTPTLDQGSTEKWVDVCTTLVADAQSYTIKRLRLRRRVRLTPIPGQPAITSRPYAVPTRSQYGSTLPLQQVAPTIPMIEHNLEEQFSEDPIVGWDSTLIDAVERVIAQSGQSSKVPSVASSRSSSRQDRHHPRSASGALPALEVPRGECRAAVLGALKEVVKGVFAEYSRHEPRDAEEGATAAREASASTGIADSILREGVRKWLTEAEAAY